MAFDAQSYLLRTSTLAPPAPDLDSLTKLARAQAFSVPFENLDILLGRGVDVAPEAIFDKLVHRGRGGYCFELNGLLLQALQHFGFDARALLARVHVSGEAGGRTHQVSLVQLNGESWLVDVGFGGYCPRYPIPLHGAAAELDHDGLVFRHVEKEPWGTMLQVRGREGWNDLYSFDRTTVCRGDIETGNHFTSTSPKSFFTLMRIATMPNELGRNTLGDLRLTRITGGDEQVEVIEDGHEYLTLLRELFGIELGEEAGGLPPVSTP